MKIHLSLISTYVSVFNSNITSTNLKASDPCPSNRQCGSSQKPPLGLVAPDPWSDNTESRAAPER